MKAKTFVNIALLLVGIAVLIYWREVWQWVSAKTWDELARDIIGFCLKWFYLAIFGWLAVTIPHYLKPWLKLARVNGRQRLKAIRRGRSVQTTTKTPKTKSIPTKSDDVHLNF
jgi:hypothetical protein